MCLLLQPTMKPCRPRDTRAVRRFRSHAGEPDWNRGENLLPVDIEPDSNMVGVLGDVVKSAKAGSTVKHFVTPKKSTELSQDYVELKAVGVTAQQITPGHANQIVEWDTAAGEAVRGEPLKWRVKRDAANKQEVKTK
jgi:hypothetical protein